MSIPPKLYADLLIRYLRYTDEKVQAARVLTEQNAFWPQSQILDVGTGNGILGCMLAKSGYQVDMLEPNPHLAKLARTCPLESAKVYQARFEHWENRSYKYDGVLLSFFLDHLTVENMEMFCQRLPHFGNRRCRYIGISWTELGTWGIYVQQVKHLIGSPMHGGILYIEEMTKKYSTRTSILKKYRCTISAKNYEELYKSLSFFFKRDIVRYHQIKDQCIDILDTLLKGEKRPCLFCEHGIYKLILPS